MIYFASLFVNHMVLALFLNSPRITTYGTFRYKSLNYRLNRLLRPTLLHSGQAEKSWPRAGQCSRPK